MSEPAVDGVSISVGGVSVSRLAFPLAALALVAVALVIYSQGGFAAPPLGGLSGISPTDPVPFIWSTQVSHREDGHRLYLQGGSLNAIVDEVRLLSPGGTVVASVPTIPLTETDWRLCETTSDRGMVRGGVPLSSSELGRFQRGWPSGYRVEARVGGAWHPVALTFAGCYSIE